MTKQKKSINQFTKEQLLTAKKYIKERDMLRVILKEDKMYSFSEVDTLLKDTLGRKVQ